MRIAELVVVVVAQISDQMSHLSYISSAISSSGAFLAALPTKEILEGQDDDEESRPDIMKIDMLVSSRHMALASPVLKAMLRPEGIKEGHTQRKAASKSPPSK